MATRTLDEIKTEAERLGRQYVADVKRGGYDDDMGRRYVARLERYIGPLRQYSAADYMQIRLVLTDVHTFTNRLIPDELLREARE